MIEIKYRCGHLHNGHCLGRGQKRMERITKLLADICPNCVKNNRVKLAHKLTHSDGSPYTQEEIGSYLRKHNL